MFSSVVNMYKTIGVSGVNFHNYLQPLYNNHRLLLHQVDYGISENEKINLIQVIAQL